MIITTFFPIKPIEWDVGPVDVAAMFFFRENSVLSVCFLGAKNGKFGKVHKFAYNAERQGSTRGTALLMGQPDDM